MYTIKPLKYSYDAFVPYLSKETISRHYELYKNYVNKLNELLPNSNYSYEEIIKNIDIFPIQNRDNILYNASGALNHEMYFDSLGKSKEPNGKLKEQINKQYGSLDNFKTEFKKQASYVIGSGYTFLVMNEEKLEIINTSNQENPYLYSLIPIMALDLWEHAYYIDTNKKQYINDFFSIVNLEIASNNYEKNI